MVKKTHANNGMWLVTFNINFVEIAMPIDVV
jgi:hypothetical protein